MFFRLISINFHCNSNFDFRWIEKNRKVYRGKRKEFFVTQKKNSIYSLRGREAGCGELKSFFLYIKKKHKGTRLSTSFCSFSK